MEGYYIVRCDRSGVFAGKIKSRDGQEITMVDARQLWFWSGAATLLQLAAEGVKRPKECKFTVPVPEIVLLDAIELIPCSQIATSAIRRVPVWRA